MPADKRAPRDGYYLMYLRKSRADVEKERYGKFETLEVHRQELEGLARREGYPVAEVYRELVSGETIAARTEFQRVMERIADKECRGVIVHAIDRLGRGDPMEYGWILSTFRWTGTQIITPGRVYDPANPDDLQQLKLQMFVSNIEFEHIRERLHQGSLRSTERGNYVGSKPPYGYDRAVIDRHHTLVPNHEAAAVRIIFSMAAAGSNKGAIARRLNDAGMLTRHGKLWTATRIGVVISNPVYKGYVRYGYTTQRVVSRDGLKFRRKTVANDDGNYVLAKGVHEPIVSEEMWDAANRKAFEAVPVRRDRSIKNPLAGLIVCESCGRALVRQNVTNKYGQHFPRLHHAYYTECQCKSVSLDYVVERLCDALEQIATDLEAGLTPAGADHEELAMIERALETEGRRLDKLVELYIAEAITVTEFKDRRQASNELVRRLRARHDELSARDVEPQELAFKTREAVAMLRDASVSAERKNEALKAVVERIGYEELDRARVNRRIRLHVTLRGLG